VSGPSEKISVAEVKVAIAKMEKKTKLLGLFWWKDWCASNHHVILVSGRHVVI